MTNLLFIELLYKLFVSQKKDMILNSLNKHETEKDEEVLRMYAAILEEVCTYD